METKELPKRAVFTFRVDEISHAFTPDCKVTQRINRLKDTGYMVYLSENPYDPFTRTVIAVLK